MFGSEEVSRVVQRELLTLPEVTAILGSDPQGVRMHFLPAVPAGTTFPCCLNYPRATQYDQAINGSGSITTEVVQFEVRFIDKSPSANQIRPAVRAQLAHLNGRRFDEVVNGQNWMFQFEAVSEIEMPHLMEGTEFYSQRGTVYDVTIMVSGG